MKLLKLDARGFAHHFLLALIVVGVACVGTYYVVFSNANTTTNALIVNSGYKLLKMTPGDGRHLPLLGGAWMSYDFAHNPAGTKLLLTGRSYDPGSSKLYTVNNDGSDKIQVFSSNETEYIGITKQAWSPDGKNVVFTQGSGSHTNIYTLSVADGVVRAIASEPAGSNSFNRQPHWSPNGSKVLYHLSDNGGGVWHTMASDGSNKTALPNLKNAEEAIWSADGAKIYYLEGYNSSSGNGCRIGEYSLSSGVMRNIYTKPGFWCRHLDISPDNTTFAFTIYQHDESQGTQTAPVNVYMVPVTGGEATSISATKVYDVAWFRRQVTFPTPEPPTTPTSYRAACTIAMTATTQPGKTLKPNLTVRNIGTGNLSGVRTTNIRLIGQNGVQKKLPNLNFANIGTNRVQTLPLGAFSTTGLGGSARVTVSGTANKDVVFNCNAQVRITR